jgi:hypothetical protein
MRPRLETYFFDGTNMVRGCFGYGGPAFRAQEQADGRRLIAALSRLCEDWGERLEAEIFFDGPRQDFVETVIPINLRVCFSLETEADELILGGVRSRRYKHSGRVTVVTADGELGRKVSQEGGGWLRLRPGLGLEAIISSIERRLR